MSTLIKTKRKNHPGAGEKATNRLLFSNEFMTVTGGGHPLPERIKLKRRKVPKICRNESKLKPPLFPPPQLQIGTKK